MINLEVKQMTQEDKNFIWSLLPDWVKFVPSEDHAWDPMWFGTLSREGDIKIHERVCKLLNQPTSIDSVSNKNIDNFNEDIKSIYDYYLKTHRSEFLVFEDEMNLTFEQFVDKVKKSHPFAKMWGIDQDSEFLNDEQRYKIWFKNNYETGIEYNPNKLPNFEDDYFEPTPKKLVRLSFNGKTYQMYDY
jgi:hypothetical protein